MTSLINYLKDINFFSTNQLIEHSNEFSIKSEDFQINNLENKKLNKNKVKFLDINEKKEQTDKIVYSDYLYNFYNSIYNITDYYGISNVITTIIIILVMSLKIIFKNLIFNY